MKKLRKLLCWVMAAVTALSMSVTASAEGTDDERVLLSNNVVNAEPDDEGYVLVSEETFSVEDGVTVTHRIYIKDNGISPYDVSSEGEATVREEGLFKVNARDWVTLWVKGCFKWNSDENRATVTLLNHGYNKHVIADVIAEPPVRIGDDQGGYWGGERYAFIEKSITMKGGNTTGMGSDEHTFRLWVDYNVNGEPHVKKYYS